ncbi:hypothetical protein D9M68_370120 [compost metagenome]
MGNESPFLRYRDILLVHSYSAAGALQDFALSCYNGQLGQFRGDALANFDQHHFAIFLEMANYYYRHRENDPHLLEVGAAIWEDRRERGRKLLTELAEHRAINPKQYAEGSERDYYDQLDWLVQQTDRMKAKGWITVNE